MTRSCFVAFAKVRTKYEANRDENWTINQWKDRWRKSGNDRWLRRPRLQFRRAFLPLAGGFPSCAFSRTIFLAAADEKASSQAFLFGRTSQCCSESVESVESSRVESRPNHASMASFFVLRGSKALRLYYSNYYMPVTEIPPDHHGGNDRH